MYPTTQPHIPDDFLEIRKSHIIILYGEVGLFYVTHTSKSMQTTYFILKAAFHSPEYTAA
jgi:hypothetical protein